MTTTAFDDQFTTSTQTERAESAEAELANLAQQKPVAWMRPDDEGYDSHFRDHSTVVSCPTNPWTGYIPLYATPVPAPHKGTTHCDDCGLTWLDDGLNPLGCPYCKARAPAPAVPDDSVILDWLEMQRVEVASVVGHRPQYGFLSVGASGKSDLRSKVRALLQSAEAQASDKLQLTPAPTHPADRNAGEVRHD